MATFSERLKMLRKQRGYLQKELASIVGVKRGTIASWESGRVPELRWVERLADVFNVSTDYLLGRTNDPTPKSARREMEQEAEKSLRSLEQTKESSVKNTEQEKDTKQKETESPKPARLTVAELLQRFADRDPETLTVEEALDMVLRSDHVMFDGVPVGHELDEDVLLDIRDAMVYFLKFLLKQSRLTAKKAPLWAEEVVVPRRRGAERLAG
ncbi:helix-turn-helix domain-containing protein [Desulfovirgula thermocuniculi]|uniref:helix-turn-helix domain-containing protein n=1 Tax=Desulfovirgula thermocuniculi TaxID=348842 RepID=UPI0006848A42|nr:helix-turn-helix domain-containing protein [Desulfovirgula thermocuniculi]